MTKLRNQYLYKFNGTIQSKQKRTNPKYSQYFYQLNLLCSSHPKLTKIFAFKDKIHDPQIWPALESDQYLGKTYLLFCHNYRGSYYLVNWKELTSGESKPISKPQTFENSWTSTFY